MNKIAERSNVITESQNNNFVHAIINAVTKGYSDKIVLDDILDLVKKKEISKGIIIASPDVLREYGESFKKSLTFLADKIENLVIVDELAVKFREKVNENDTKEEIDSFGQEEKTVQKEASIRFAKLAISDYIEKYQYDENKNKISGVLILNFNEDMSKYCKLQQNDINAILDKIYKYCKQEYKNLIAKLDTTIFKSNIRFSSITEGKAYVEYEINGAF